MPAWFTVLASGSSGNASLLEADGFGLLIDCGLGPQALATRLAAAGRSWKSVSAVLLTHTHGDHWNPYTLAHLRALNLPLVAHPLHHDFLSRYDQHAPLRRAGLARPYEDGQLVRLGPAVTAMPVAVPHDSDPTFGFRIDLGVGPGFAVGYASDAGHVTPGLSAAFEAVDILAVEYNHDVRMQRASRRPRVLIDRVLGTNGHLSNEQAAAFTTEVAGEGGRGLQCVVQLHLSRECNTPDLAAAAGRAAVNTVSPGTAVLTARPFEATPTVVIVARSVTRAASAIPKSRLSSQPLLPGFADGPVR